MAFWRSHGGRRRAPDRNARRVAPGDRPVEVQIIGAQSLDVLRARDISETGLGVYVPHRFAGCDLESDVDLVVTLPGRRSFSTRGRVRHWSRTAEVTEHFGVEFTRLSRAQRDAIRTYVAERLEA